MSRTPFTVVTAANSVRKLSNADTGNARHACIHVEDVLAVANFLQEFEKKSPSFLRFKNFPPPFFPQEEEREREKQPQIQLHRRRPTGLNPTTIGKP